MACQEEISILAVDDTPENLHLLNELLKPHYRVRLANSGQKALRIALSETPPDLILLDVMMPEMNGHEVCIALKADERTREIPVVFVTAMTETENELYGFSLGAIDYITKPISPPVLLARVATHLALRRQAQQLAEWNQQLEQRVREGVAEVERLSKLRRFFSPAVAELLLADNSNDPLKPRRKEIVVVFLDLRGYTAFTEMHGADEVMRVLSEFHQSMGELIMTHGGTLERFAGDGLMIFFNDPIEISAPAATAIQMAIEMQERFKGLQAIWQTRNYNLAMGIGIAKGSATIGAIGFEGRRDYGAIGSVTNLAARLCGEAKGGQILIDQAAAESVTGKFDLHTESPVTLKGFAQPVPIFSFTDPRG